MSCEGGPGGEPVAPHDQRVPTIAIVGAGPRGLSLLERLVGLARTVGSPPACLVVELFDPYEPGVGRIWRTDQSDALLMNTVVRQITIFGPDPERPGHETGPSFRDWLDARASRASRPLGPDDYAPRRTYGEYLGDAFRETVARAPRWMSIRATRDEVVRIDERRGRYILERSSGSRSAADCVVLTTGHLRNRLRPREQRFAAFADAHPGLRYVAGDCAADMPLDAVGRDDVVALRGLGLTFYDIVALLTTDRGGRFEQAGGGRLEYRPSGAEPRIVAGSRSGLPFPARGTNQKGVEESYAPVHCTIDRIDALREHARRTRVDDRLDFQREVLPLVELELRRCFLANLIARRRGDESAQAFLAAFDRAPEDPRRVDELRARFGVADADVPDLARLSRPFDGARYASPRDFQRALTEYLKEDLRHAAHGNRHGPLKGALDVLRDLRGVIRHAVDHNGLLPDSQAWFESWYSPRNALLSAGPPAFRVKQLLALMRAGIVEIVGPQARFGFDGRRFVAESPCVHDSAREATWLVEACSPDARAGETASPLYAQLLADGSIAEHVNPAAGRVPARNSGGLAVSRAPYRIVDASGHVCQRMFSLGLPNENTVWFTQVGSSKPGASTSFTRDAEAIAAAALEQLCGRPIEVRTLISAAIGSGD
jgi:hypothetical protein